ncbi:aspartate aminotransferase family protein [Nocardia sp. alder85J]|uniref:aspartate aminotransferase family protein n=1 Tax=Nocardia sp. alder85J TaxID=2862949 RepID=UPI001CD22B21|nr:aminotransferase class III-fold pyridoxal phosphate-dependent enzyme [Nocardia sp. alder85J]MCX4091977.1 aminotransferase class III-fold pyridoxal phosphate-dependent enzyme [Nocardia sp. alder85J]
MTTILDASHHNDLELFAARTLPGPRSARLLADQERQESNARTYPRRLPFGIASARGSIITDVDGNHYVDLLSGAGVLALGHSHPELVTIAQRQLELFVHGLDMPTPVKAEFTGKLLARIPGYDAGTGNWKVHFCGPTGANAVDAAIKLARIATGRHGVISFQGGFHGTTHLTMGLTGLLAQRAGIAGIGDGVHFLPYSDSRNHPDQRPGDHRYHTTLIESLLTDPNGGIPAPAAVILEIVQGEGGVVLGDPVFLATVANLAHRLGALLIVDEIQTGCGRTGTFFAYERHGIRPDVVCLSKALSGIGTPISVLLYRSEHDVWGPGTHTGTFRGNQLAFATGSAFLDILDRDDVLGHVAAIERTVRDTLGPLPERSPHVYDVRGIGAMWGIEFVADSGRRDTGGALARAVQELCVRRGIVTEVGGRNDSVLRLLPPLNIDLDLFAEACAVIAAAVDDVMTAGAVR